MYWSSSVQRLLKMSTEAISTIISPRMIFANRVDCMVKRYGFVCLKVCLTSQLCLIVHIYRVWKYVKPENIAYITSHYTLCVEECNK